MLKLLALTTVCAALVVALAVPAHGAPVLSSGCTEANAPEFDGAYSVGSVDGRVTPFNSGEVLTITAISSESASGFSLLDILSPGALGFAPIPGTLVYTIPTTGQLLQWGIVLGTAEWVVSCTAPPEPPEPPTLGDVLEELDAIVADNPGTPLADKAEDAATQVDEALGGLGGSSPDVASALGRLEGAAGDLEAMVGDGLVTEADGEALLDVIAASARELANDAIADAEGGDPAKLAEANAARAEGDALRDDGSYKDAVAKYKAAYAKAADA